MKWSLSRTPLFDPVFFRFLRLPRFQCHLPRSWLGIPHRFADQSVAFDPPLEQTNPSLSPPLLAPSTDLTSTDISSSYIAPTDSSQRDTAFPVHILSDVSSSARAPRSAGDKLSALPSITDLRTALTDVVTPLKPDQWQSAVDCLRVHRGNTPFEQVDSIPTQIREGFDFGLRHLPREPITPSIHISNDDDASREAAAKELLCLLRDGRIAGPFDYDWLRLQVGSFRSNPLSVIEKRREPGQPPKHRVIENMSYPRAYDELTEIESCNDLLAANNFPLFWFRLCGCFLPSSSPTVATPAHDDLLGGSNLHSSSPLFRGRTTPGVFGNLADVTQDFLELRFPSITVFKQVDDVIVFCPDAAVPRQEIEETISDLGWKLAPDKGFDWTRRFTFVGKLSLGIVIDSRASVFPLPSNWKELRDAHITVAEAWAVEALADALIALNFRHVRLLIRCDSTGVLYSWRKGRSTNRWINKSIEYLRQLEATHDVSFVVDYGSSSIVDASRRASSRIDVGHLPHSRLDIEVTTDFRQWNIFSGRGKASTIRRSSQMRAINMRLITSFSSTFASLTPVVSKSVQDPPCSFSATAISKGECSVWTIIVFNEAHSHRSLLHTGDSKSRLTRQRSNLFRLGLNGSCIVFLVSVMRSW
ncbi:BQ5605_C005g03341 [Microbotryum silenes-dioicae]|uniref:BQ5605_C005g03341 protein n=1 Tax=Microbotryum silenes-dioicae TaxID=796604 RepID=A0A2X0MDQ3_9BASI|nr:BQ5605_C005g03341 [Microbotryum silenes-dioicae]